MGIANLKPNVIPTIIVKHILRRPNLFRWRKGSPDIGPEVELLAVLQIVVVLAIADVRVEWILAAPVSRGDGGILLVVSLNTFLVDCWHCAGEQVWRDPGLVAIFLPNVIRLLAPDTANDMRLALFKGLHHGSKCKINWFRMQVLISRVFCSKCIDYVHNV